MSARRQRAKAILKSRPSCRLSLQRNRHIRAGKSFPERLRVIKTEDFNTRPFMTEPHSR